MNLIENKTLRSQLHDEEAVVVENAVRLAIDSVLNVLYGVNGARTREYQRMVADRDKEIQRLEGRLTEIERELQVLRRHGCTCGLFEAGSRTSANRQTGEQIRSEAGGVGPEVAAGPQDCDLSLSSQSLGRAEDARLWVFPKGTRTGSSQLQRLYVVGVYPRPSSHFPSQYHESLLPSPPSYLGITSTCTSRSSEASGGTEAARNLPTSPSSLVVKEEPCDVDAVLIEWELSEDRAAESQEQPGSPCPDQQSPDGKYHSPVPTEHVENNEGQMLREKTPVNPAGFQSSAGDQLRNKKKNVPMSQLTEEAQRLKRAAWRAASKRYYARKIARQQASLHGGGSGGHTVSAQRGCLVEERRKRMISDLPEESQMMRREMWRASSRRYYDRKTARHATEGLQYGHLNPAGATQGPNGEGPLVITGIMCS